LYFCTSNASKVSTRHRVGWLGHVARCLPPPHIPAPVSIRQRMRLSDVSIRQRMRLSAVVRQTAGMRSDRCHPSAYVSICQHTSAYVSICQYMSACFSICQHTSACVMICGRCDRWPSPSASCSSVAAVACHAALLQLLHGIYLATP
jgi:hypothetical protein